MQWYQRSLHGVVFVVTFSCIFIKLLSTRGYLVSFLGHFCPTGVNTKESLYYWGWIPKPMMDIYTQRGRAIDGIVGGHSVLSALLKPGLVFTLVKRSSKLSSMGTTPWFKAWLVW